MQNRMSVMQNAPLCNARKHNNLRAIEGLFLPPYCLPPKRQRLYPLAFFLPRFGTGHVERFGNDGLANFLGKPRAVST